jgi:hypothetical protein
MTHKRSTPAAALLCARIALPLLAVLEPSPAEAAPSCTSATPMSLAPGSYDQIDAMYPESAPSFPYFWAKNLYSPNILLDFWGIDISGDPQGWLGVALAGMGAADVGYGMGGTKWLGTSYQYGGTDIETATYNANLFNYADVVATEIKTDGSDLPAPLSNGTIPLTEALVAAHVASHLDTYGPILKVSSDSIIMVMLPPNATMPGTGLGRHGLASLSGALPPLLYAWILYPVLNAYNAGLGSQERAMVHEYQEALTDPLTDENVSLPSDPPTGPYTSWSYQGNTCEMGDGCQNNTFTVQPYSGLAWTTQQFFSNEAYAATGNGCVYGRTINAFLFGVGTDHNLYGTPILADTPSHTVTSQTPLSWGAPAGVTLAGTPGAASWGPGRLDVFVRASTPSASVYHATQTTAGYPGSNLAVPVSWEALPVDGGDFVQSPDAVSWGAGNLQVFAVVQSASGNPVIVTDSMDQPNAWTGFQQVATPRGIYPVSKVAVAAWGASSVAGSNTFPYDYRTVLATFRGNDGNLWSGWSFNHEPFTWTSLGHPIANVTGDPEISVFQPTSISSTLSTVAGISVLDTSGQGWTLSSADGITFPTVTRWVGPFQGAVQVGPGAVGMGDGRVLLAGRVGGSGSPAYVNFGAFNSWTGWNALPVGIYSSGVELVEW